MENKKQIRYGIIIGLTASIIIQHFLFGQSDMDYNIFHNIKIILGGK